MDTILANTLFEYWYKEGVKSGGQAIVNRLFQTEIHVLFETKILDTEIHLPIIPKIVVWSDL